MEEECYYPNELEFGTLDWQNASHKPVDSELQAFIEQQANKNTSKKTISDIKIFERYCKQVKEERAIENIPEIELDCFLGLFFKDITKTNGENYEPDTLTGIHRSLNRYLHQKGSTIDIIADRAFQTSRITLAARRKQLRSQGMGQKPNASKSITMDEENLLFENGQLGEHSPEALIRTVWYFLTLHMEETNITN